MAKTPANSHPSRALVISPRRRQETHGRVSIISQIYGFRRSDSVYATSIPLGVWCRLSTALLLFRSLRWTTTSGLAVPAGHVTPSSLSPAPSPPASTILVPSGSALGGPNVDPAGSTTSRRSTPSMPLTSPAIVPPP